MNTLTLYRRPSALNSVFADVDGWIDSFFGTDPFRPAVAGANPAVDVRETDDGYFLEADLPGLTEKDLEVRVDGRTLTIESKKEEKAEKKEEGQYVIRERRSVSFSRAFTLPEDADAENVEASFKNGVLELSIKKRPEAKRRFVEIKAK